MRNIGESKLIKIIYKDNFKFFKVPPSSFDRARTDGWMDEEDGDAVGGVGGTMGH